MSDDLKFNNIAYNLTNDKEREKSREREKNQRGNIKSQSYSPNTPVLNISTPVRKSINDETNSNNNNNFENNTIYSKMKVINNTKLQISSRETIIGKGSKNNDKISNKSPGEDLSSYNVDDNNFVLSSSCERCYNNKESYKKAVGLLRNYVDCINERLNFIYHKVTPQKKTNISSYFEMDYSISPEFYHTLYYSEIDKIKLSSEIGFQLRSLMKSLRLFNDKYEYINKKHDNFEKAAQDYKNIKISNKTEELKNIPEYDNEIKNLEVQKIFQNFNQARENFENTLRDIKSSLNSNERNSITENKIFESLENNLENKIENVSINMNNLNSNSKESYLKNEVSRLVKENTSLRLELNYIYEQLKEENKIHAIYKSIPNRDSVLFSNSPDVKPRKKHGRTESIDSINNNSFSNPILILPIKNDNKDEKFIIARSYIKRLKNSEYFFI